MRDLLYSIFSVCIAIIGYQIHHSLLWAFVDLLFAPIVLLKWAICHEINLTIIQQAFSWFFH